MASDSSMPKHSDDLDLDWDDEPSSPVAAQPSSSAPSAPVRESAARVQGSTPSTAPRAVTPRKPLTKKPSVAPPPSAPPPPSTPPPPSAPRYSLRPVSIAPRPSSSPSSSSPVSERPISERPIEAISQVASAAAPALSQAPQAPQELPAPSLPSVRPLPPSSRPSPPSARPAPPSARPSPPSATLVTDVALEAPAPPGIGTSSALEVLLSPPSVPSEWPDSGNDTLRPSQLDVLPAASAADSDSVVAFRPRRPWLALIPVGVAAGIGLIWLVASATPSAPVTIAEPPKANPTAPPSPVPASPPPAVAPAASTAPSGTLATSNSSGFADSFKAAVSDTQDTRRDPPSAAATQVAVHISPSNASVFKYGQLLGSGDVIVNVAPGTKVTLVARLDGYMPRTLAVDGSNTSINIALKRSEGATAARKVAPKADGPAGFNPY